MVTVFDVPIDNVCVAINTILLISVPNFAADTAAALSCSVPTESAGTSTVASTRSATATG